MQKIQKATKQLIKRIRDLCIKRYQDIIKYILEADEEEIDLRTEAVEYLIENEPYFVEEIIWMKNTAKDRQLENEYKEKIRNAKPSYDYFAEYIIERIRLVEEMLQRINNKNAKTESEIKHKQRQTKKFEKELDNLKKSLIMIDKMRIEFEPPKRKVGRPKKNKVESIVEEKTAE